MNKLRAGDLVLSNGTPARVQAIVADKVVVKYPSSKVETVPIHTVKVIE